MSSPTSDAAFNFALAAIHTVTGVICLALLFARRNTFPIQQRHWQLVMATNVMAIIYIPLALIPDGLASFVEDIPCSSKSLFLTGCQGVCVRVAESRS